MSNNHKTNVSTLWVENLNESLSWTSVVSEVFQNRSLAVLLAWRSITVRTKQSFLGHIWPIFQPLVSSVVFFLVFNKIAGVDTNPVPYMLFAYTGSMVWSYTSASAVAGTTSIVVNTGIVTKTYFSRILLPVSACIAPLYNLAISAVLLVMLCIFYGVEPRLALLSIPLWVAFMVVLVVGYSLVFSTLNVIYRDIGQLGTYIVQLWMYASPVAYPAHLVAEAYKPLYYLNPLAGVLEGFRWAILGTDITAYMLISLFSLVLLLILGLYIFCRFERTLADHL